MGRGRKIEVLPHPKELRFELKDRNELEPAVLAEIELLRHHYEQGHREVLLGAVSLLLRHYASGTWVSEEFAQCIEVWEAGEVATLGEAFRITKSHKGTVAAHRVEIISAITNRRRERMSRADAIAEVAKLFKAGESTIAKVYDGYPRLRRIIENLPMLRFLPRKPTDP
jgi:hypothetical protein